MALPTTIYVSTNQPQGVDVLTGVTKWIWGSRWIRRGTFNFTGWEPGRAVIWPSNMGTGDSPTATNMPVVGVQGVAPVADAWTGLRHAVPDEMQGIGPRSRSTLERCLLVSFDANAIAETPAMPYKAKVFTAATNDVCTSTAHTFESGDRVTPHSAGTIPPGLSSLLIYEIVKIDADSFKLTLNGSIVDITGAGSGTHTMVLVEAINPDLNGDANIAIFPMLWDPKLSFTDPRL
jgi:hypothetical protein